MKMSIFLMLICGVSARAYDIPKWEIYCAKYTARGLACTEATWAAHGYGATPAYAEKPPTTAGNAPAYKLGAWGSTVSEMQSLLPENLAGNFAGNANINAQMSKMQQTMRAVMSTELARLDTTRAYTPVILKLAAQKLSAANLITMRSAFGSTVDTYVADYSPVAVAKAYAAAPKPYPLFLSQAYYTANRLAVPVSVTTMAYYDVFLVQFTSATDPPIIALHKAVTYAQVHVKGIEVIDIIGLVGGIIGIVAFFDPNAWDDIVNVYHQVTTTPPPDTTRYVGLEPTVIPITMPDDPTGGTFPQNPGDLFPDVNYGDDGPWSVCDFIGGC